MKSAARDGDKEGDDGDSARSALPVEVPMAQTLRPTTDNRTHTIDVQGPHTA
ncbi:hypothetical protein SPAR_22534 [Streptomyces sparsogenes DSM 40356]|uniref:Uncharacterized protein n=1 Tax=Streptomyces sparsogenes DSM 40356 TaxID=1331668 RepID=A0A1R1SG03_9ACTN|nr:hypothetical protein SPAR_22534 [Streptomyces sparsogenes DSM 40356]